MDGISSLATILFRWIFSWRILISFSNGLGPIYSRGHGTCIYNDGSYNFLWQFNHGYLECREGECHALGWKLIKNALNWNFFDRKMEYIYPGGLVADSLNLTAIVE